MPASSRIRDDYTVVRARPTKARRWPWLVCGFAVPLIALPLIARDPASANPVPEQELQPPTTDTAAVNSSQPAQQTPAPVITADVAPANTAALQDIARAAAGRAVEEVTEQIEVAIVAPAITKPSTSSKAVQATELEQVALPEPKLVEPKEDWLTIKVRPGDALSTMIESHGMSTKDWLALSRLKGDARVLTRLMPGETFKVLRRDGRLQELNYSLDEFRHLHITRNDADKFEVAVLEDEIERHNAHAVGNITSSLFMAGQDAGLSDRLIMELANIFGWDIDFALDMRVGDRFVVVYEELHKDGEKVRNGDIVAAEFVNQGKAWRAVRYTDETGYSSYYTPEGAAMRKAFLRTPVAFGRISSGFSLRRKHPVLNRFRAHKGVDYAAPTGTPIRATGDGKIISRGTKGGYGRTVVIRHGSGITTLYAHMSAYKRGQRVGSRVRQGQTVGYVGASGLASGPHLHYEFRMNGVHKNPLRVSLPRAKPIPKKQRQHFDEQVAPLVAQLNSISTIEVAMQ